MASVIVAAAAFWLEKDEFEATKASPKRECICQNMHLRYAFDFPMCYSICSKVNYLKMFISSVQKCPQRTVSDSGDAMSNSSSVRIMPILSRDRFKSGHAYLSNSVLHYDDACLAMYTTWLASWKVTLGKI